MFIKCAWLDALWADRGEEEETALNVVVVELPDMAAHVYAYHRGLREYYMLYLIETGGTKAVAPQPS